MTTATAQEIGIQVGDYFASSWGYDQTNIDYWQVVEFTASGKSVKVRKCYTTATGLDNDGRWEIQVMPGQQEQDAPVETKRLHSYLPEQKRWSETEPEWHAYFKVNSYSVATWQGTDTLPTHFQTAPGYGH